ncbi:MAG TPA: PKD domain-containing protein [Vicinamibacterales bacterium]|nr:PKD domain-containing protein [Vicinamibacterales bacterium]
MRMRTSYSLIAAAMMVAVIPACTVSDVDAPAPTGPSSFAYSISLEATPDVITQDGVSTAQIRVRARDANGLEVNGRPLRAAIIVDGAVQDFGMLSTKQPVTGQTFTYTAPPPSPIANAQNAETITIGVTPVDQGDFRGEHARTVDIRLVPMGIILPQNPTLQPAFQFTPTAPKAMDTVSFTAAATTNGGVPCGQNCSYSWNFGDNTSGSGMISSHQFRTPGAFQVTLTVTDSRGAQAVAAQLLTVAAGTPPTAAFTFSPSPPYATQDIFLNAETSTPAPGRTIVSYAWNFGDGRTASGNTVVVRYPNTGTYTVTLRVTDDASATASTSQTLTVSNPQPVPQFTVTPSTPTAGGLVEFNAANTTGPAPIATYDWNFGNGQSATGVTAQTTYAAPGQYTITLRVTDTAGRTATVTRNITVN